MNELQILKEYLNNEMVTNKQVNLFVFDNNFKRITNAPMIEFLHDMIKEAKQISKDDFMKYMKKLYKEFNFRYFNIGCSILKIKSNGQLLEL